MSIELEVPLSISGDRELVGGVNESLLKHYVSKVLQPASINLIALDASTGSGNYKVLSTEGSSIGQVADTPLFGTNATMSANDEFYISDTRTLKELWANVITAGVFTADGIDIFDSTNGTTFNRQLTGVVDNTNAFRNLGWRNITWTQPATAGVALALAPTSNDAALNTARLWYKVKLRNFTAVTTAPVLARITPIFVDAEQKWSDLSGLVGFSITSHAGSPLINLTFFPVEGDEVLITFANPARGYSIYSFRKNLTPADAVVAYEYFASDNTWKPLASLVDESNDYRNGPTVLTEPPTHFDLSFTTPTDWTEKTIELPLTNGNTLTVTGFHIRRRFTAVPTKSEIQGAVVSIRAKQYGSANTSGVSVTSRTIDRVSVELKGAISGTADAGVFQVVNLTTGATSQFTIPSTATQGAIVNVDISNMVFNAGDTLGLERISGSRTYTDLGIHLL